MAKVATRRLMRQPNGQVMVVFIDTATGKVITNLQGYKISGQGENFPGSEEQVTDEDKAKEETSDQEDPLAKKNWDSGDYYGNNNEGGNLGLNLSDEQKNAVSKLVGGIAGGYFGGPIGAVLGAKVAERIIPKLLEEVKTVEKEEGLKPTTSQETLTNQPVTTEYNPKVSEQIAEADRKSLTSTAIEENPFQDTPAKEAIDTVTAPSSEDLEGRTRQLAGIDYNLGPNRPNVPEGDITAQIRDVVTDMLGPDYTVRAVSGQESVNPITGKRDQYGSNRHRTGMAMDFDIVDPDGNVVKDTQTLKDVAQLSAARYGANVGYGPEYMGVGRMHMDTVPAEMLTKDQDAQWGSVGKKWADDLALAREQGVASPAYYDKMTQNAPVGLMSREDALRDPNEAIADVAFDRYTPQERDLMARTLAGEIDLSKTDLNTEEGRREAFGILSTMENRANRFGGIEQAITADRQYSTWNDPRAANVANTNYEKNREMYDSLVSDMERDQSLNTGYTSYYNPSIANPDWGAKMNNALDIGAHRFGSLPEYASAAGDFGTNFGRYGMTQGNVQNATTDQIRGTAGLMADATTDVNLSDYTPNTADSFSNGGFGGMTSAENSNRDGFGGNESNDSFGSSLGESSDRGIGSGRDTTSTGSFGDSFSESGDYSSRGGMDSPSEDRGRFGGDGLGTTSNSDSYDRSKDDSLGGTSSTSSSTSSSDRGYSGLGGDDSPSERTGRFG